MFRTAIFAIVLLCVYAQLAPLQHVELNDVFVGAVDDIYTGRSLLNSVSQTGEVLKFVASASAAEVIVVDFCVARVPAPDTEFLLRKPHQSFVRLMHVETGHSTVYAAKKMEDSSDEKIHFVVSIALVEEASKLSHLSGLYDIFIFVGDQSYRSPISLLAGKVDVKLSTKQVSNLPLYSKSLLHTSDNTLQALPEITHVMRPPSKQASSFMSSVFTALTVVPLLAFIGFLMSLRPNLGRMSSLSSVALAASLALTLCLYVGYWLALEGISFYQTIKYLCFIFPTTVVIGRYALSAVSEVRLADSLQKKSKLN